MQRRSRHPNNLARTGEARHTVPQTEPHTVHEKDDELRKYRAVQPPPKVSANAARPASLAPQRERTIQAKHNPKRSARASGPLTTTYIKDGALRPRWGHRKQAAPAACAQLGVKPSGKGVAGVTQQAE